jgi:hypothetical protein
LFVYLIVWHRLCFGVVSTFVAMLMMPRFAAADNIRSFAGFDDFLVDYYRLEEVNFVGLLL